MLPEENKTDWQIIQYLTNFWEHSLNDTLLPKNGNMPELIRKISKTHPEQIQFHNDKSWYFIQDYHWYPDLDEAMDCVCKTLNIQVNREASYLLKDKVFRPVPTTFTEFYNTVLEFRTESQNTK